MMLHHVHPQSHHKYLKKNRSIRKLWYEKISVWRWLGPAPLVIFLVTANYFAYGNFEQNNFGKKIMGKKLLFEMFQNLYHIMMS